jgi:hypothetical protein
MFLFKELIMSLKKNLKMFNARRIPLETIEQRRRIGVSLTGQASLEYFVLFLIVTLGIIASNFLWFNGSQGKVRNIAQTYFDNASQKILGN